MKILINNHIVNINNQFDIDLIMGCKGHMPINIANDNDEYLSKIGRLRRILEFYYKIPNELIETESIYKELVTIVNKIYPKMVYKITKDLFNNKKELKIEDVVNTYAGYLSDLEIYR